MTELEDLMQLIAEEATAFGVRIMVSVALLVLAASILPYVIRRLEWRRTLRSGFLPWFSEPAS